MLPHNCASWQSCAHCRPVYCRQSADQVRHSSGDLGQSVPEQLLVRTAIPRGSRPTQAAKPSQPSQHSSPDASTAAAAGSSRAGPDVDRASAAYATLGESAPMAGPSGAPRHQTQLTSEASLSLADLPPSDGLGGQGPPSGHALTARRQLEGDQDRQPSRNGSQASRTSDGALQFAEPLAQSVPLTTFTLMVQAALLTWAVAGPCVAALSLHGAVAEVCEVEHACHDCEGEYIQRHGFNACSCSWKLCVCHAKC